MFVYRVVPVTAPLFGSIADPAVVIHALIVDDCPLVVDAVKKTETPVTVAVAGIMEGITELRSNLIQPRPIVVLPLVFVIFKSPLFFECATSSDTHPEAYVVAPVGVQLIEVVVCALNPEILSQEMISRQHSRRKGL